LVLVQPLTLVILNRIVHPREETQQRLTYLKTMVQYTVGDELATQLIFILSNLNLMIRHPLTQNIAEIRGPRPMKSAQRREAEEKRKRLTGLHEHRPTSRRQRNDS